MEHESRSVKELAKELNTDENAGLTEKEASERILKIGRNEIVPRENNPKWFSLLAFANEPMMWLLVGAAAIYFVLGDNFDAWIMLAAAVPIALIDVVIEYRTENALEKLRQKSSPKVKVIRGGIEKEIDSTQIVPGDIFIIVEGDIVPADAVILESSDLKADESPLTGESMMLDKEHAGTFTESVFNNKAMVFAGTTIMGGKAKCIAMKTGISTEYGKIGKMISSIEVSQTPLQKNIDKIVKILGTVAVGLSIILFLIQIFFAKKTWTLAMIDAVSLAIAAIPEEFPITFVFFLSIGAWVLARGNALVKRMVGVETLGSVTVICTDKTGTLTTGTMTITEIYFKGKTHDADKFLETKEAQEVLEAVVLASEKNPFDPMEKSIFEYASRMEDPEKIQETWKLETEYAFDRKSKYMSHVWSKDKKQMIFAKGSIEGIFALCRSKDKDAIKANEIMAKKGIRVLALARKQLKKIQGRDEDEKGMEFVGLIGFSDPIREGVPEAVKDCQTAGIRVVMLTGDHKATAKAIAMQAGLKGEGISEGYEIETLDQKHLNDLVRRTSVFSRVNPEQKLAIVTAFKSLGETVAVTGDGINDAPALKKADIGVAMGLRGTEVAREAATMVLLDDNFVTIVEAIKRGRSIYDNLKKAFNYLIAFHIPIFLSALIIPLMGLPLLLMPIHIIFLELFLHPVVSIVFQQQQAERDIMTRQPRKKDDPLINGKSVFRLVSVGGLIFLISLAAYIEEMGGGEIHARSLAFSIFIFSEVFLIVTELAGNRPADAVKIISNKALLITMAITISGWIILGSLQATQAVFKIAPLNPIKIVVALVLALIPLTVSELWKRLEIRASSI